MYVNDNNIDNLDFCINYGKIQFVGERRFTAPKVCEYICFENVYLWGPNDETRKRLQKRSGNLSSVANCGHPQFNILAQFYFVLAALYGRMIRQLRNV